MNSLLHIPPPVYAALSLALCKGIDLLLPLSANFAAPLVGVMIALPALALIVWAWLHFFLNKTTPVPTGTPSHLVVAGPYRFTRNPMYLGLLMLLASVVFFTGTPVYLLSPLSFFWITDRLFIPYEESKLEQIFATEFAFFKISTRRWL